MGATPVHVFSTDKLVHNEDRKHTLKRTHRPRVADITLQHQSQQSTTTVHGTHKNPQQRSDRALPRHPCVRPPCVREDGRLAEPRADDLREFSATYRTCTGGLYSCIEHLNAPESHVRRRECVWAWHGGSDAR
jgi:hypothetical protein